MIKIIAGVYGYRTNGRIEAKTNKSSPFSLDEKEEARLVKAGVAEYVEATEKIVTDTENETKAVENLEKLNLKELKEKAEKMSLTVEGKTKQDYIDAIKNALEDEEGEEAETATEPVPTFDAAGTVV